MKSKLQSVLVVTLTVVFVGLFASPLYAQTANDTLRFQAKNTGFGLTDINNDNLFEILMFDDNTGFVRVFQSTGTDKYEFVKQWQPAPLRPDGIKADFGGVKSQIPEADFDGDGVKELYLSDTKGHSWIVTPNGIVNTMFDDVNWTMLHDWKLTNVFNEGGEARGNLIGDVDGDGKPDIYLAGNNFGSILDMEWDGGTVDDLGDDLAVTIANDGAGTGKARVVMASNADAALFAAGDRIQLSGTLDEEREVFAVAGMNVDLTTNVTTVGNNVAKEFIYAADVTSGDDYSTYVTAIDENDDLENGHFARPANIQLTDMDGDGLKEILAIVPWSGSNPVENLLGLYLFEQNASSVGDNLALTNVWHEASDAIFSRGYIITGGGTLRDEVDIDKDGLGEFLTYEQDGGQHIVYLFEAVDETSNDYQIVWQYQFGSSTGQLGIAGNERGIMVTDIDGDGDKEIVVIVDSVHPDSTDGFDAGHIFEWDGTGTSKADHNGLPSTPTATFDPPRDAVQKVSLENNSVTFDVDNDGRDELILTHRGGNGIFLSIIELTATEAELTAGNVTMKVEFVDEVVFLPVGIDDSRLGQTPREFSLGQNYPNPFNPSTNITYDLPASVTVSLNIYDILGRNVITLVNEQQNAGSYIVEWNGKNSSGIQVTSGIYFYRLEAGRNAFTKKMLLLK
ncbi:MAG: T9SS type A sorting domain-containing protein [Candidatus Marinimicrobia bacterium]|nr:T9SS type A sorting domain-containing protein [Candidatus Neomarinimicrobiota bacterium]